jgi:methionyl-tRNA formyltransferase
VHASLLPRWRGAAPVERAIMAGDAETGVCVMRVVAELDAGPVGLREGEPIAADDTYGTLAARLAALGGELLVRALDSPPVWEEQGEDGVTYAEKIGAADRLLDPLRVDAVALDRRVRALTPHVGAFLELPGDAGRLGVSSVRVREGDAEPGRLVEVGGVPVLGCRTGAVELLEVKPPGKRPMAAVDWLRGRPGAIS